MTHSLSLCRTRPKPLKSDFTLQIIGAQLYTSTAHKDGGLDRDDLGEGYGYPVHKCMRDLLVGYDKEHL